MLNLHLHELKFHTRRYTMVLMYFYLLHQSVHVTLLTSERKKKVIAQF